MVWFMAFNATFKNISVTWWRSVLLVEETGIPEKTHRPVKLYLQYILILIKDVVKGKIIDLIRILNMTEAKHIVSLHSSNETNILLMATNIL